MFENLSAFEGFIKIHTFKTKKKKKVVWKFGPSEKEIEVYSHQIILDSFLKGIFITCGGESVNSQA